MSLFSFDSLSLSGVNVANQEVHSNEQSAFSFVSEDPSTGEATETDSAFSFMSEPANPPEDNEDHSSIYGLTNPSEDNGEHSSIYGLTNPPPAGGSSLFSGIADQGKKQNSALSSIYSKLNDPSIWASPSTELDGSEPSGSAFTFMQPESNGTHTEEDIPSAFSFVSKDPPTNKKHSSMFTNSNPETIIPQDPEISYSVPDGPSFSYIDNPMEASENANSDRTFSSNVSPQSLKTVPRVTNPPTTPVSPGGIPKKKRITKAPGKHETQQSPKPDPRPVENSPQKNLPPKQEIPPVSPTKNVVEKISTPPTEKLPGRPPLKPENLLQRLPPPKQEIPPASPKKNLVESKPTENPPEMEKKSEPLPVKSTEKENVRQKKNVATRLQEFESELGMWNTKIENIDNSQLLLLNKKRDAYERLVEIHKEKKKIELYQLQLVESDKYEEVELLDAKLHSYKTEIDQLHNQISEASRKWINLEDEKSTMYGKITTLRREGIKKLKALEEEQTEAVDEIMRKLKQENEEIEYSIGSKGLRIERDLEHIKADLTSLCDKQQRIQSLVHEKTATQCIEKEQWVDKQKKILSEIASLLARIEVLKTEDATCREKITRIDADITQASERYQADLRKIEIDKNKCIQEQTELLSKRMEIQKEQARFQKKLETIQGQAQSSKELLASIEKAISNSRDMIEVYDQKILECQDIKTKAEHRLEEEVEETPELKLLRQNLLELTEQTRTYSTTILQLHGDIRSFEQSIKVSQETNLPNLENEKKIAVGNRDFKTAQNLHKQILALKDQIDQTIQKKKEADQRLHSATELRQAGQASHDALKKEISIKEREQDLANLGKVIARSKELHRAHKKSQPSEKPLIEIQKLEADIAITQAKVLQICFKHDLQVPEMDTDDKDGEEVTPQDESNGSLFTFIGSNEEEPRIDHGEMLTEVLDLDCQRQSEGLDEEESPESRKERIELEIGELEQRLQRAISEEDYEKADEIQIEIDTRTREKEALL